MLAGFSPIVEPTVADMGERARDGVARRSWHDTFAELATARDAGESSAEDLERLAVAAYMVGRDDASETAWMDAHRAWSRLGEPERAARCAFRHALGLFFRGDLAPASGWVARGRRVLEASHRDCVERAWLSMLEALPRLFGRDPNAVPVFAEAERAAVKLGDDDAATFARLGRGYSLVSQGRTTEGMALLDEVMVAVTAEDVSPLVAGIAYCQTIALCQEVFDVRRAREWTNALSRWCDAQPGLVPFRGNCLVHRCEIFRLEGAWPDALAASRKTSTGTCAARTTSLVTLPSTRRPMPRRPWVAMITRSIWCCRVYSRIVVAGGLRTATWQCGVGPPGGHTWLAASSRAWRARASSTSKVEPRSASSAASSASSRPG